MHPQLEEIAAEFESASARLRRLVADTPAAFWDVPPAPGKWSAAECVAHLNRTGEEFLPLMREALERARALAASGGREARVPRRFRRGVFGWLLWAIMPPPVRLVRSRTTAAFEPSGPMDAASLAARFAELQQEQLACVRAADGLPVDRVQVASPFNARAHYPLFACLGILPRHQHRHLWQAEQAVAAVRSGGGSTEGAGAAGALSDGAAARRGSP
jgi:hypothetical protein